jgi:hypothetical protein
VSQKPKSQMARVVAAARSFRGVSQVDLLAPNVVDGKSPITRLAARIFDAERQGYSFEVIGRRGGCKVYRLVSEPGVERTLDPETAQVPPCTPLPLEPRGVEGSLSTGQDALFEAPVRRTGHYEEAA